MMRIALLLIFLALLPARAPAAPRFDETPRTAVISAFAPELAALQAETTEQRTYEAAGVVFTTGVLESKPVVLLLSGMSMVNATMSAQLTLDRFRVERIVFTGIAGGVDPGLNIGDLVVADRWSEYLESVLAREVAPGQFQPALNEGVLGPNFGMIYPKTVEVRRGRAEPERRIWFPVDPALLSVAARAVEGAELKRCVADRCLAHAPKVVVGGAGVSGQSFVDNAAFRAFVHTTFEARVLDMESAAVAHVAYANATPFIAFRGLSDLAGGEAGPNQVRTFFQLAADNSATVVRRFLKALP